MNDRYLSRGKRKDNRKWVHGSYVEDFLALKCGDKKRSNHPSVFVVAIDKDGKGISGWVEVDPATVGQCTGLTDKKGTLVFEGDICFDFDQDATFVVFWDKGEFAWKMEFLTSGEYESLQEISSWDLVKNPKVGHVEIIGNIYI